MAPLRYFRRRRSAVLAVTLAVLGLLAAAASGAAGPSASWPSVSFAFTPLGQRILVGADANSVRLPDGRVRVYWAAGEGQASATSTDGVRFTREPGTRLDMAVGGPHTRTVALPDGRWRLFFTDSNRHGIGSAISDDGLTFAVEPGLRVSAEAAGVAPKLLSPGDVVKLRDGRWRMYFSSILLTHRDPRTVHEVIKSAVSSDLLDWRVEPGVRIGGRSGVTGSGEHPSAVLLADGSVALFYGRPTPFHLYVSVSRDGLTFTSEQPLVDQALDSAVVAGPDGSFLLYYGTYVPATDTSYLNVGRLAFHRTPPPPTCTVPDVRGRPFEDARAAIQKAHCAVGAVTRAGSTTLSAGWVIGQTPRNGTWLPDGAKVKLVVSRGPGPR